MTVRNNQLPKFKDRDEEAAWFETHMANLWEKSKPANVRFSKNLSAGLNIRLDPQSLERLRGIAHEKGIGPTTLARMWIKEHLSTTL